MAIKVSILLSMFCYASLQSSAESEALMDLYNATNGPAWYFYFFELLRLEWRNLR
jgi:hypothetical protein